MRLILNGVLAIVALLLGACDSTVDLPCEAVGQRIPLCGVQAPEDIEVVPGERYLLLSHFGGLTGKEAGFISLFDTLSEQDQQLFPLPTADSQEQASSLPRELELWGDPNCDSVPSKAFSPHGIHLSRRSDQRWQLLAVNHGNREAVEFFEWLPETKSLAWRGCAQMPAGSFLNDVVASPEGGLLVSHMFDKHNKLAMLRSLFGANLGHVWYWRRGQMLSTLPNSEGSFPNGLQISADGRYIFVNMWGDSQIVKFDRRTGIILGTAAISHPDNSAWLPDGRLLVASQYMDSFVPKICTEVSHGFCPSAFRLIAIDPHTMETETLFEQSGPPMGAGTVAVEANHYWYIGSFAGNRLLKAPATR